MTIRSLRGRRSSLDLVVVFFATFLMFGCSGDDGLDGRDGQDGAEGPAGVNCWDLNENGIKDPEEDLNGDGEVDTKDCNAIASGAYDKDKIHVGFFTANAFEGTADCLSCHGLEGADMLMRAHFTWEGTASNITGFEGEIHGKNDIINNFCVAVPSNEGRCAQCHAGYGYVDKTFDFSDRNNVDCLICHDQTDTYVKGKTNGGLPADKDADGNLLFDINAVARSVGENNGEPQIKNCIVCHANAGGGDNVKHGDLAMALLDTTREHDVHMGTDSRLQANCVTCHQTNGVDHGIGGMPYHSIDEGVMKGCVDCHGDTASIHVGKSVEQVTNTHTTLACQVCHIPTFADQTSTKTEWYWETAGQDLDPAPDPNSRPPNRPTYDKKKGNFVWSNSVRPTLLYFDGKWDRRMIGTNEQYTTTPVDLGSPSANYTTPGAMIYPFKKMIGNQPADANNNTMLVPHLFGMKGGPNPFWGKFDWDLALRDGAEYTGQTYTGEFEFVPTFMYLTVNHEVAPAEEAYGNGGACADCHLNDQIDWQALGWTDDPIPLIGGERIPPN